MLTIILYTLGMIAATFVVGLAVAWLISAISSVLYYFEHRSLIYDIRVRLRLLRLKYHQAQKADTEHSKLVSDDLIDFSRGEDRRIDKSQLTGNQLINFYKGINRQFFRQPDDSLMSYYHGSN